MTEMHQPTALVVKKLESFRNRIDSSTALDGDLKKFIAIELFDFVQENPSLKGCFYKHLDYLKNLAISKDFNNLQDDYIDAVIAILKLTDIQDVEALQAEFNNKLLNRLKKAPNSPVTLDYLTLPELYGALLNKTGYYRLGDHSYFEVEHELSMLTHVLPLLNQIDSIESFIARISYGIFEKKPDTQHSSSKSLLQKHDVLQRKIYELVYNMPVKLHVGDFEKFILFCSEIRRVPGYEGFYTMNKGSVEYRKYTDRELGNIKKCSVVVIDDLIEYCEANRKDSIESIASSEPSKADRKKLFILEKLKEKWDLVPKKDAQPTMIQAGVSMYLKPARETRISHEEMMEWISDCGLKNYYELEDILHLHEQEGLIEEFENISDYK